MEGSIMNKHTKIAICVLAVFVVGMTLSVAFAEPVSAKKYKNKKSITVKIKDGKKTIKVKCKYKKGYKQGECDVLIAIEKWYRAEYNDSNLCIQSLMEWDDDGCCLDCIECIKNHCT
jgi:hypothetical protein